MIKKLTAIGDSHGLIIEEPILIRPARESRRQRVRQATERLMTHPY